MATNEMGRDANEMQEATISVPEGKDQAVELMNEMRYYIFFIMASTRLI